MSEIILGSVSEMGDILEVVIDQIPAFGTLYQVYTAYFKYNKTG